MRLKVQLNSHDEKTQRMPKIRRKTQKRPKPNPPLESHNNIFPVLISSFIFFNFINRTSRPLVSIEQVVGLIELARKSKLFASFSKIIIMRTVPSVKGNYTHLTSLSTLSNSLSPSHTHSFSLFLLHFTVFIYTLYSLWNYEPYKAKGYKRRVSM